MFSLIYKLDDRYNIDGKEYNVNASFDNILRLIKLLDDKTILPAHRVVIALKMLIGDELEAYTLEEKAKIVKEVLEDYVHAEDELVKKIGPELDIMGNPMKTRKPKSTFSFEYDAKWIYGSFMSEYGIDLLEQQGKLHWFRFKSLLDCLSEKAKISQIMAIRTWNPNDDENYESKMRRLQSRFRLPDEEEELNE